MPELPEVETIRRDLTEKLVGRKIKKIEVVDKKISQNGKLAYFLSGKKIFSINRVGKLLIFDIGSDNFLLIHLRMTGQLIYTADGKMTAGGHSFGGDEFKDGLPNKHTRVWMEFSGGEKLFFNDVRRFGLVKVVSLKELGDIKEEYGIEPLLAGFTVDNLKKAFSKLRISIKAALLDQKKVAGIGNIYADEVLFAAKILPWRVASSLSDDELKLVHREAERIIAKAIEYRGTTFSDYLDANGKKGNFTAFLQVYGRNGEKCTKCGGKISKKRVAGRGTHFCLSCQK
jgi:formamidopyrimidine-DNA glycosylase